jgi:hypothetical protein
MPRKGLFFDLKSHTHCRTSPRIPLVEMQSLFIIKSVSKRLLVHDGYMTKGEWSSALPGGGLVSAASEFRKSANKKK